MPPDVGLVALAGIERESVKIDYAVLGAGMAGFGAVHHLHMANRESVLFEKKPYYGGHTSTYLYEGKYTFDDGPHISFTKNERLQELFAESVDGKYEVIQAKVNNYWRGHWIKHPAQCNLHGLPQELIVDIIRDFVDAQNNDYGAITNYHEWLLQTYGKTFAETFPMEYGFKYHTLTMDQMTTDWLGPRMYAPKLEEVLNGALSPTTPDVHYVDHFRYPSHEGFVHYLKLFAGQTDVRTDHELVELDPKTKTLRFANGNTCEYENVISSIPLPALIPMITGAPKDVVDAAALLVNTMCVLVNVVIDRVNIVDANWSYFYDRDIFFTRLSYPHLMSPHNVPEGCSSIQAEVYYSNKYRPLDRAPEECIDPTVADLRKVGLIQGNDKVLFTNAVLVPYANIIYNHDRSQALDIVHGYLQDIGVTYCGRYGEWDHAWTDEAFLSGEGAAERVLSG